ncbi:MAG: type II toxin-antitoxin system ParD family antitoxin [Gammaproteobacteria bacterium]
MPTRNLVITQHQQRLISALVATGRYKNASEVMREGLRLIERREAENAARIAGLQAAIDEAELSIENEPLDTYTADLLDEIDREEQARYANDHR